MLNPKNFFKYSYGYAILKNYIKFWHDCIYYDSVKYKNIPTELAENEAYIIVSNHQNSLMDPLVILLGLRRIQPIFMTRANIFKNPVARFFLTFLKMLPIYRPRDGRSEMANNEQIFKQCVELLSHKRVIGLFPEGTQNPTFQLAPLKKGTARIALMSEVESDWTLNLKIIPAAIHYTDLVKMGAEIEILYGKPFIITDFKKIHDENPAKAVNELTARIKVEIEELMEKLGKEIEQPKTRNIFWKCFSVVILLLTSPIALFGFVSNAIPFYAPFLLTRRLKDTQFTSSIRFAFYALVTFPIWYLILKTLAFSLLPFVFACIFVLLCAISGYIAHQWGKEFLKLVAK